MRYVPLFALMLLPQLLRAQFGSFEPGSYVLHRTGLVNYSSRLKYQPRKQLLVAKDANGQTRELTPYDVAYFRIGAERYSSCSFSMQDLPQAEFPVSVSGFTFVPLLDSGQVLLMRYDYVATPPTNTFAQRSPTNQIGPDRQAGQPGNTPGVLLNRPKKSAYLLSTPTSHVVTVLPAEPARWQGIGFHRLLAPYLENRPDLAEWVYQNRVTEKNLEGLIHAFNTGQPYAAAR